MLCILYRPLAKNSRSGWFVYGHQGCKIVNRYVFGQTLISYHFVDKALQCIIIICVTFFGIFAWNLNGLFSPSRNSTTLTVPLSAQVHRWVLANLNPGITLRCTLCNRYRDNLRPDTSQDEIACFRISETWRKHAAPWFRYIYVLRKRENLNLRDSVTSPERKRQVTFPSYLSQQITSIVRFRLVSAKICIRVYEPLYHALQIW